VAEVVLVAHGLDAVAICAESITFGELGEDQLVVVMDHARDRARSRGSVAVIEVQRSRIGAISANHAPALKLVVIDELAKFGMATNLALPEPLCIGYVPCSLILVARVGAGLSWPLVIAMSSQHYPSILRSLLLISTPLLGEVT